MGNYNQKMLEGMNLIDKNKNKNAVVFDIDETLLYNGQIIRPIFNLYKYARASGLYIILITARPGTPQNKSATIDELHNCGIIYDMLYMMPEYMTFNDIPLYKILARRRSLEDGYTPLFSIGDKEWDTGIYGGVPLIVGFT